MALDVVPSGGSKPRLSRDWIRAIRLFHESTERLRESYRELQERVRALNLELRETNLELEHNLKEKERLKDYLHNILESLKVGVMVLDLDGRVTLVNRALLALMGGRPQEIEGRSAWEILERMSNRDALSYVKEGRAPAGFRWEDRLIKEDGQTLEIFLSYYHLQDGSSQRLGSIITMEDITALKSMEEEVARSQRLSAMGKMAADIAHEVRNPLGSIKLFASLLVEEEDKGERKRLLDCINSAIDAVDHVLSNLLTFARPIRPRLKPTRITELLMDCVDFMSPLARQKGIEIKLETHEELLVLLDRNLMKRAILNIMLNALQAMSQGGRLCIWTHVVHCEEGALERHGAWVELGFQDNGPGIPSGDLPHIFDPFFTTKENGTGLGLAIVHNILKAHGGSIRVISEEGKGTLFLPRLPVEGRELQGVDKGAPQGHENSKKGREEYGGHPCR